MTPQYGSFINFVETRFFFLTSAFKFLNSGEHNPTSETDNCSSNHKSHEFYGSCVSLNVSSLASVSIRPLHGEASSHPLISELLSYM
jgi:hypothetical protein